MQLISRHTTKEIFQQNETYGITYRINTPKYFSCDSYPNNVYCVWNIANKGFVTYRIMDKQLQEPSDCDGPGCNCPDSFTISAGDDEIKLCGNTKFSIVNRFSWNGLQMTFCSDNKYGAKGILMTAYRHISQYRPVPDVMSISQSGPGPVLPFKCM